jgi:hypothetical protein
MTKTILIEQFLANHTLTDICESFNSYAEEGLDRMVLPHPLLEKMSIWEFFYLMSYHVTHHLDQTKQNLM